MPGLDVGAHLLQDEGDDGRLHGQEEDIAALHCVLVANREVHSHFLQRFGDKRDRSGPGRPGRGAPPPGPRHLAALTRSLLTVGRSVSGELAVILCAARTPAKDTVCQPERSAPSAPCPPATRNRPAPTCRREAAGQGEGELPRADEPHTHCRCRATPPAPAPPPSTWLRAQGGKAARRDVGAQPIGERRGGAAPALRHPADGGGARGAVLATDWGNRRPVLHHSPPAGPPPVPPRAARRRRAPA